MDCTAFTNFLQKALGHMVQSSEGGSLIYACMDWRHMSELLVAARANE
jgi:hypothetical protein